MVCVIDPLTLNMLLLLLLGLLPDDLGTEGTLCASVYLGVLSNCRAVCAVPPVC